SITLALTAQTAATQTVNGSNNGNGNTGVGNGNGNGNASNNVSSATGGGASSNVTIQGRRNTPTVVAPSLAASGTESCLGSNSVGGSGAGFGVTFAGTVTDRGCNLRLYARTLHNLGHRTAATLILCNDPDVARALLAEGVRCPGIASEETATPARSDSREATRTVTPCSRYDFFRGCLDAAQ
ncbi:MAG: hypothetical protein J0H62_11320, partial [Rhizobiales bacterium]|nr:hypothetical protein [Hyphomicrobiales bacterium]